VRVVGMHFTASRASASLPSLNNRESVAQAAHSEPASNCRLNQDG